MKIIQRSTQIFLGLMAVAFCKVGIETLIDPVPVLANVNIDLTTISAISSMRAVYGGMHLIFGLFCAYGVFRSASSALGLVVLYSFGFVIGRLSGIIADGAPNEFVTTWLATEVISLLIAGFLWLKIRPKPIHV